MAIEFSRFQPVKEDSWILIIHITEHYETYPELIYVEKNTILADDSSIEHWFYLSDLLADNDRYELTKGFLK